jgi:hypothetical protein
MVGPLPRIPGNSGGDPVKNPSRLPSALALSAAMAAFLVLTGPAMAQITTLEEAGPITDDVLEPYPTFVYGFTVFGAFGTLGMSGFNESIVVMNNEIRQQGTEVAMDGFSKFLGAGGGFRSVIRGRIVFDAVWERFGESQSVGGLSARNEIEVPADSYQFTVGWDFLKSARDMRFGFAAGVGYYESHAKQTLSEARSGEDILLGTLDLKGSSWGSQYKLFFETGVSDHVFLYAEATWRVAKVKDVEITGLADIVEPENEQAFVAVPIGEAVDADGNVVAADSPEAVGVQLRGGGNELDYSGFEGRVGFTYYFNIPTPW